MCLLQSLQKKSSFSKKKVIFSFFNFLHLCYEMLSHSHCTIFDLTNTILFGESVDVGEFGESVDVGESVVT